MPEGFHCAAVIIILLLNVNKLSVVLLWLESCIFFMEVIIAFSTQKPSHPFPLRLNVILDENNIYVFTNDETISAF